MLIEEISNRLRFMSGEVVEDDLNLLPRGAQGGDFFQEDEEVTTVTRLCNCLKTNGTDGLQKCA